jgi:hypothetical protein
VSRVPGPAEGAALVVDLPGETSVAWGLALAGKGYRPVPLYNGVPHEHEVVPARRLAAALLGGAERIRNQLLLDDAPPAFLLDSRRLEGAADRNWGKFDNRWLVLPQDFPSANLLRSRHLDRALLIQHGHGQPQEDLAHVLLRWQQAGIAIEWLDPAAPRPAQAIEVRRPGRFRSLWYRVLALLGLRRHSAGGFGALIPEPGSSSG